jgi:imidazolonepropionase
MAMAGLSGIRGDRLWKNARIATCAADLGIIESGAIACRDGRIIWVGPQSALPPDFDALEIIDCAGRWITPGLIDCHTHLIFAGNRSDEFARRQAGESYADIARSGGGILATMRATRDASENQLVEAALSRLDAWIAEGVTTIEIKSGYGLDRDAELRLLGAAREIGHRRPIDVAATYLGAHAMPPDRPRDVYLAMIRDQIIPCIAANKLADAIDGFCETIAFAPDEIATVFEAARRHGLPVKLHADQLSDGGGAGLAARFRALSADHLEYASEDGVKAMAQAGTVAVLLPGAFYMLREPQPPPIAAMRRHGVAMAVATDCNPGTSPLTSLLLAANMACVLFGLTIGEAWLGITRHAAAALGRSASIGSIEAGKACDLAIWNTESLAGLIGWMGPAPLHQRVFKGISQ